MGMRWYLLRPLREDSELFFIQEEVIIDTVQLINQADEGAMLVFVGMVRDFNKVRDGVLKIEYQCYKEMAEKEGKRILGQALEKFEIARVHCIHRIGLLSLQETAIRLEIRSAHRLASLRACEYIMDEIKLHVPIWKKEFYGELAEWM